MYLARKPRGDPGEHAMQRNKNFLEPFPAMRVQRLFIETPGERVTHTFADGPTAANRACKFYRLNRAARPLAEIIIPVSLRSLPLTHFCLTHPCLCHWYGTSYTFTRPPCLCQFRKHRRVRRIIESSENFQRIKI